MSTLHRAIAHGIGAGPAVSAAFAAIAPSPPDASLIALLQTPKRFALARLQASTTGFRCTLAPEEESDSLPADLFHLRAFLPDKGVELRWTAEGEGGQAAILSLMKLALPAAFTHLPETSLAANLPSQRLLFGRAQRPAAAGWSRLAEPRIGSIWAPLGLAEGQFAELVGQELVGIDPEDGNAVILDELLVALRGIAG